MKAHYYTNLVEGGRNIQRERRTNQGESSKRDSRVVRYFFDLLR